MRLLALALTGFVLTAAPASAALVWGESNMNGYPLTHWARGATVNEVTNTLRAYAGDHVNILQVCRQPGWFAYVGSDRDFRRGVSCGYKTRAAALYKAQAECHHEGGSCEVERVGYDDGKALANVPPTSVPQEMPGAVDGKSPVQSDLGVISLQE